MGGGYLNNKKVTPKKSLVIGVLVGGIVFGSIGVVASTYFSANQVSYTPTDSSWNVSDVKGALDDLYSNISNYSDDKSMVIPGLYDNNTGSSGGTYTAIAIDTTNFTKLSIEEWATSFTAIGIYKTYNGGSSDVILNLKTISAPLVDFDISGYDIIYLAARTGTSYGVTQIMKNIKLS